MTCYTFSNSGFQARL